MVAHLNVLERDAEINGDGNVVLTTPEVQYAQIPAEYVINHVVVAIAMMQLVQINNNNNEVLGINVVDDGNGENSHLDAEHSNPTSDLLPGNVTDHENGHASQLDGDHANRSYGIYKLLNIYAVSQAGILAAVSSVRGWSRLVLSGLVSTAIIVVLLIKFCQKFRQLREEEYRTWVAQKAAIVRSPSLDSSKPALRVNPPVLHGQESWPAIRTILLSEGYHASILLDSVDVILPEKEAFLNENSLRGYEFIDVIKATLEKECPLTVSCADIIALSARDVIRMAGGPSIRLATGRRDGTRSIATFAEANLPSPGEDADKFSKKFMELGFNYKDIVSLLGAHTIGRSHCRFFEGRFNDFRGTGKCDPSMGTSFTDDLRSMCNRSATIPMDNDSDQVFDPHYYKNIVAGNGVLHVDQALNAFENTSNEVHAYAADNFTFYRAFSRAMVKLISLGVLTGQEGQIWKNCSKVVCGGYYTEPEIVP